MRQSKAPPGSLGAVVGFAEVLLEAGVVGASLEGDAAGAALMDAVAETVLDDETEAARGVVDVVDLDVDVDVVEAAGVAVLVDVADLELTVEVTVDTDVELLVVEGDVEVPLVEGVVVVVRAPVVEAGAEDEKLTFRLLFVEVMSRDASRRSRNCSASARAPCPPRSTPRSPPGWPHQHPEQSHMSVFSSISQLCPSSSTQWSHVFL